MQKQKLNLENDLREVLKDGEQTIEHLSKKLKVSYDAIFFVANGATDQFIVDGRQPIVVSLHKI